MTDCYQQQSWRMQIPDDFWRVQDVGFRADEGHAAVLSVHQQLSTEMFTEQVTSSFIIDCTMDAWHDPDSIAALQILPHGHSQNTTTTTIIITNVLIRHCHENTAKAFQLQEVAGTKNQSAQWLTKLELCMDVFSSHQKVIKRCCSKVHVPPRVGGWVDLGGWWNTEVISRLVTHPSTSSGSRESKLWPSSRKSIQCSLLECSAVSLPRRETRW